MNSLDVYPTYCRRSVKKVDEFISGGFQQLALSRRASLEVIEEPRYRAPGLFKRGSFSARCEFVVLTEDEEYESSRKECLAFWKLPSGATSWLSKNIFKLVDSKVSVVTIGLPGEAEIETLDREGAWNETIDKDFMELNGIEYDIGEDEDSVGV
jgi:hypothetical protein